MIKVVVQIPCYNEVRTLAATLRDIPRVINGVDVVEIMVIDDGSNDGTADLAHRLGVRHVIRHNKNLGLAQAFRTGVNAALRMGADILINTDADNQYYGADIVNLVKVMLTERADLVIGCRPIRDHPEFSTLKKFLQRLGSSVVRMVSHTDVPDAASGFRAYSRDAMLRLNVVSNFSYCMETIIQAGAANMKVCWTNIRINPKTRESRLFHSLPQYIWQQAWTIINIFILYHSGVFFRNIALGLLLPAFCLLPVHTTTSLLFLLLASQAYLCGVLGSMLAAQRKLSEETNYHLRSLLFSTNNGYNAPAKLSQEICNCSKISSFSVESTKDKEGNDTRV